MRVRDQLEEIVAAHVGSKADHEALITAAWEAAQLPGGLEQMRRFPHQLSGGQQQRVAIAMALVCRPAVIVMDEPTTGLDVLTQQRLLDVIGDLRARRETSIVYISHDLGVVRNLVDDVIVMYGGRVVEQGAVDALFQDPQHPYTRRLLEAIPRVRTAVSDVRGIPGHAVEPWNRPAGCPFAPRCEYRIPHCDEMPPPIKTPSGFARCWRIGDLAADRPETRQPLCQCLPAAHRRRAEDPAHGREPRRGLPSGGRSPARSARRQHRSRGRLLRPHRRHVSRAGGRERQRKDDSRPLPGRSA